MINGLLVFGMVGWTINASVFQAKGDIKTSLTNAALAVGAGVYLVRRIS